MSTSGEKTHTPGPWAVNEGRRGRRLAAWICTVGNNPNDPAVFSTVFDGDKFVFGDKVADAHLIAAAPDMLAALLAAEELAALRFEGSPEDAIAHVRKLRRAAIALATPAEGERT